MKKMKAKKPSFGKAAKKRSKGNFKRASAPVPSSGPNMADKALSKLRGY